MLQDAANFLLTPILGPLLKLPPWATLLIIAAIVSLISVLFQKHFTNQKRMRQVKKDMKKYQDEMKALKDQPEKAMKVQQKMMPLQMEMMKEGFKPALWTMIPFLLLFMWLSANFAYMPLLPGQDFDVTVATKDLSELTLQVDGLNVIEPTKSIVDSSVSWTLNGPEGYYTLSFLDGEELLASKNIIITTEKDYESPIEKVGGKIKSITIGNEKLRPLDPLSLGGWRPSWIVVYIIFSLVFSMSLRKIFDVV